MKKLVALLLSGVLMASTLPVCQAASSNDQLEQIAQSIANFEPEITFKSTDPSETLLEVFQLHPELYYYFQRYDGSSRGKTVTLSMEYKNTDVDTVYVVDSAETLYNVVGNALLNAEEEVALVFTASDLNADDVTEAIEQWHDDNYLVYMGYEKAAATVFSADASSIFSSMTSCDVTFTYMADSTTLQTWRQQTEDAVVQLCGTLFAQDMPDYMRELKIHDYLVQNCQYEETTTDKSAYTAYGALCTGKAVCEGYAEAARLLFTAAGLESDYVEGKGTSGDHAWNVVQIAGEWYWVDVTWDDPVSEDGSESEEISHTYFNLTDTALNSDHSWQPAIYPSCTSNTWNYDAVKAAVDADTNTYSDYSTSNVTLLADVRQQLTSALGASGSPSETTPSETTPSETAPSESQSPENTEKSGGGFLKVVLVIFIILLVLVIAYLIYRRICYLQMLKRKKAKAAARKRAQQQARKRQQPQPPARSSSRYNDGWGGDGPGSGGYSGW